MKRLYDDGRLEVHLERYNAQGDRAFVYVRFAELTTGRHLTIHLTAGEADELGACLAAFAAEAAATGREDAR